ncbi:MAG: hypothetical protein ACTSUE_03615 [Promethearchaeota archaeon]
MKQKIKLNQLLSKILLFLLIYSGFYLLGVVVEKAMKELQDFDELAIIVGLTAIISITLSAIVLRYLAHHVKHGWHIVVLITGVSIGIGALTSTISIHVAAVLVTTGAPGLILLIDPSRVEAWSLHVFGVKEDAKLLNYMGIITSMFLLMFDLLSLYYCLITFISLSLAIAAIGIISLLQITREPRNKEKIPEPIQFGRVPFKSRGVAVFDVFVWTLYPIMLLFVLRELAVLSTFGTALSIQGVVYLSMASLGGGLILGVVFWYGLALSPRKKLVVSLISLLVTGATSMLLIQSFYPITGVGALCLRVVLFVTFPLSTSGIYMRQVPNLKTTFLNFFRTFMTIISSLFTVVFLLFFKYYLQVVFNILYMCLFVSWTIAYLLGISFEKRIIKDDIEVSTP